jgi:uncharacterized phage-like protein YoqJ
MKVARLYLNLVKPDAVLSGMALGWDTAVALVAIELGIPLIACLPFAGQESRWPEPSRKQYAEILAKASRIVIVSEGGYSSLKMQIRNQYMVDNSDELVALWDGSAGGTWNCIQYAESKRKTYINLYRLWEHL